ncbi:hypothetical protein EDC96DRAFT_452416 [Choanephora cucurbitarum]|nr:hypothetical protein EDC96DRAFT_452416 [Choanephora cucurbitarum]
MKETDHKIIGYARRSKGEKDDTKRAPFLLNLIVEKLKTRSQADKVFISPNFSTEDPFNERNENKREELMSRIVAKGDKQVKERIFHFCWKKVILVTIDFAGLFTSCEDTKSFLNSIKEIVVDLIPSQNKVRMWTSCDNLSTFSLSIDTKLT